MTICVINFFFAKQSYSSKMIDKKIINTKNKIS